MKRFLSCMTCLMLFLTLMLCGCGEEPQVDRDKELKEIMTACDSRWEEAFPDEILSFRQIEDYLADWSRDEGIEVTKRTDHYIVLTSEATKGQKETPSVTFVCSMDPANPDSGAETLSLGMTSLLGPLQHGPIRLIVTEATADRFPGAVTLDSKYLDCAHCIRLYPGSSDMVYTAGALSSVCRLTAKIKRADPSYTNAFRIRVMVPENADPYTFDKEHAVPNPVNVLGDLLAYAKSSGRLFEIASFEAEENEDYQPAKATAVVVIDNNNVEAFQKRFEKAYETLEDKFKDLELDTEAEEESDRAPEAPFKYTMKKTKLPDSVLQGSSGDNIISLMYTLQTGIHLQDEETGAITAASYIRSVSTEGDQFSLVLDMRSRDGLSMEEMAGNYLITSGLCDVDYSDTKPGRLWTAENESSSAAWFTAAINGDSEDPTKMQTSEANLLYARKDGLDLIEYRYNTDRRPDALDNILCYLNSLISTD